MTRKLFCFGLGYSALELARRLMAEGWSVAGTCRSEEKAQELSASGIEAHPFDGSAPLKEADHALDGVTHVVISIPPERGMGPAGDPALRHHGPDLAALTGLGWLAYLSTTGVYGNWDGAEVDETSELRATSPRGQARIDAEAGWRALHAEHGLPVHVFRLAGIYGPGRTVLDQVRAGKARCIEKPGHAFSRIHRDDIAGVLEASIARPDPGAVYNVCDDLPAPSADVTRHAAALLGMPAPKAVPFEEAAKTMSPMGLSFWADNRWVSNRRVKEDLGYRFRYPTYKDGLAALMEV